MRILGIYTLITICLAIKSDLDRYTFVPTHNKYVLFVGKTGAGKTTLIETVKDANHVIRGIGSFIGRTRVATSNSFSLKETTQDGKTYNIHIMDTPGLFDLQINPDEQLENKKIMDLILKCINSDYTTIHQVYYVFHVGASLDPEDVASFQLFYEAFINMSDKISLIVTRSQDYSDLDKNDVRTILATTPGLEPMKKAVGGKVFFMGTNKEGAWDETTAKIRRLDHVKKNEKSTY